MLPQKKIASNHGCCSCQIIAPGEEALILYVHDPNVLFQPLLIADIYISISMETFEHRKYKIRGDDGND